MGGVEPVRLYHNPRCSKSRGALEILRQRGADPEVIEYLKQPPDRSALEGILDRLEVPPRELVRRDARFAELGLDPKACETREQVIALLLEHPELMQRPVAVRGERAVLARPPEKVAELL